MQLWKENDESLLWKKPNVCKSRQRDVTYTFLTNMGGWWVPLTFWRPFRNKPLYTAQEETALPLSSGSFSAAQPVAQLKLVQMSALCFTLSDFFFFPFSVLKTFFTRPHLPACSGCLDICVLCLKLSLNQHDSWLHSTVKCNRLQRTFWKHTGV